MFLKTRTTQIMGADGWIYILDADLCDQFGFNPQDDFENVYDRVFLGKRIWTIYSDTALGRTLERDDKVHSFKEYQEKGIVMEGPWEVWT
jgi:hypothetical protein